MTDPRRMILVQEQLPPENQVLIVKRNNDQNDQVEIRGGIAYCWRYESTDDKFCDAREIVSWRTCGGFDF